ncbi:hypothetical protein OIU76_021622 [Salix suchowensis]|nr:hypothetical protein OIU76_021622 [Salix suchowensis]
MIQNQVLSKTEHHNRLPGNWFHCQVINMFQMFLESKLKDTRLQGKYGITTSSAESFSNGCNKDFEFNLIATMMDSLVLIIVSQRTDSNQAKFQ